MSERGQPQQVRRSEAFDVCVIGAGAAGLAFTEMLGRSNSLKICLLEAGPEHFRDRREPYVVRNRGKEHAGVNEGRVTAFGGATNTWGGGLIRLSPTDFEPVEGRPDTAWPIPFDSMIPHYEAVETLFGFKAPQDTPFLDLTDARVQRRTITVLPFRSKNFAHRFGPSVRRMPNVRVLCNANIVEFHPDPERGLDRIDVDLVDGDRLSITARRFVITAGIVNTNLIAERIFRACGVRGLEEERGRYFHDHVSFPVARLRPKSQGAFSRRFGYRFSNGMMLGEHFDIESKGSRLPGAFLHMAFDMSTSSVLRPVRDILNAIQQRKFTLSQPLTLRDLAELAVGVPRLGIARYFQGHLYLDKGTTILARLDLEQLPLRECRIEGDPDGPGCAVDWDLSSADADLAARYLPACHAILQKLRGEADFDVENLVPDPKGNPAEFVKYLRESSLDTLHSSGGLRMGDALPAPVDSRLRLAGVPNVHALSSAVFPRVGTSNPTHTILALGHRLAVDILASR
jgi:choline dehydrogenase-like flavoprotein